jgi:hypothetical protein
VALVFIIASAAMKSEASRFSLSGYWRAVALNA